MTSSDVCLKTAVNTRLPLSERLAKKSADEDRAAAIASMHNPLETTYDVDYSIAAVPGCGGVTQRTVHSASNRFKSGGTSKVGKYSPNTTRLSVGPFRDNSPNGSSTDPPHILKVGGTSGAPHESSRGSDDDPRDGALLDKEGTGTGMTRTYTVTTFPHSQWESEAHAATRCVQPEQRLNFYACARKEEQLDDEQRGALVGATQRAIEIRTKRATAPDMCPPKPSYRPAEPVEMPLVAAQEKGLIRRNYLDLVECEHTNPDTEQQMGFDQAPEGRLPGEDLSWDLRVQSKAITHMGTSEEMFKGTAKCLETRAMGYAGHVPQADSNLQFLQKDEDTRRVYAKSYMTLAVHGGGVDATITSNNLQARHRGGKRAPAPKMLQPRSEETVQQTVEGKMLYETIHHRTEKESTMNFRDDKQAKNYF